MIKKNTLLIFSLLLFFNIGFSQEIDKKNLFGLWTSIGYGHKLEISKKKTVLWDVYESGCNINIKLPTAHLDKLYSITKLTTDSLQIKLGFTTYDFIRDQSKSVCNKSKNNSISNFNALWHTFNEQYAFFDVRGINWKETKDRFCKKLKHKSSDLELYNVLSEMISELNDGHSEVYIPDSLEDKIEELEEVSDELKVEVINTLIDTYLPEYSTYNKGIINWGKINEDTSYIQFNDFENLANYNIPNSLSLEAFAKEYWGHEENSDNYTLDVINGFKAQMKLIFEDIKHSKTCIIDVRFNSGGFDEIGLEILSYFTNEPVLVFSKKARFGNDFTKKQNIYLKPNSDIFNGKVYILTSPQTASASETFVLASKAIENIVRVGSNTEGILSDILSKRLPNGWEYGLSNEIYESYDGTSYEHIGIPPDHKIDYSRNTKTFYTQFLADLKNGDKAIDTIIKIHNK